MLFLNSKFALYGLAALLSCSRQVSSLLVSNMLSPEYLSTQNRRSIARFLRPDSQVGEFPMDLRVVKRFVYILSELVRFIQRHAHRFVASQKWRYKVINDALVEESHFSLPGIRMPSADGDIVVLFLHIYKANIAQAVGDFTGDLKVPAEESCKGRFYFPTEDVIWMVRIDSIVI